MFHSKVKTLELASNSYKNDEWLYSVFITQPFSYNRLDLVQDTYKVTSLILHKLYIKSKTFKAIIFSLFHFDTIHNWDLTFYLLNIHYGPLTIRRPKIRKDEIRSDCFKDEKWET